MSALNLPPGPRILVVALRRLGDVLLTTPLIRSLQRAWPGAKIDALVYADTAGVLKGNPDLNAIVAMSTRPTAMESLRLAVRLFRQYDLAISTQRGDRPTFFAIVAGRRRIAPVESNHTGRVKRAFLNRSVPYVRGMHRVEEIMRLVDAIGIKRVSEIVCPSSHEVEKLPLGEFAVIHAAPMFCYKQWTKDGWRALVAWLTARGVSVIATGGPSEAERSYLDEVWNGMSIQRLDGRLDWPHLAGLLSKARVYIGPDTSVTHLAAATGCPTVALYGPTDPRLWGPWPLGGLDTIWAASGTIQRRGNVWLVQNPLPCMPCQLEGCERRLDSKSCCLTEMSATSVIAAVTSALEGRDFPSA